MQRILRKYACDPPRYSLDGKIQKDDGLPQQICIKCYGKLDFTCEFVMDCYDIQKKLYERIYKNILGLKKNDVQTVDQDTKIDMEADKENRVPKINQLISQDQKYIIKTSYKVDMTLVDDKELERNLTLLDQKKIKCNICAIIYSRMDKCKTHIMSHLKMKPYICTICNFATVTPSNIRTHIRKTHLKIKPYACNQCEKRFSNAGLLQDHLNTHSGARPFKCQNCDLTFSSRQVLSSHSITHMPSQDIKCEICDKTFYSSAKMRAHMHTHNKDNSLICNICKARLSNKATLDMHTKNVHSRKYSCDICGKILTYRKAWHNHQNVHAEAKFKCTMCPNVYKSKHILKEHLLKHEGIRKYKCTVCEKSFFQQSHLAAHSVTHSEARFACPGCEKLFNRHDNMKIHTKRCQLFLEKPELKHSLRSED